MTTHDRDKVIAAANKCFLECFLEYNGVTFPQVERFYAIAFEDGRQAEREGCYALKDDAMEIFNANSLGVSQETRDVIEWFSSSIRARSTNNGL